MSQSGANGRKIIWKVTGIERAAAARRPGEGRRGVMSRDFNGNFSEKSTIQEQFTLVNVYLAAGFV